MICIMTIFLFMAVAAIISVSMNSFVMTEDVFLSLF